jgi:hypothetical protein
LECKIADRGDGIANRHARHAIATIERIFANGSDGIRNRYARKPTATHEGTFADGNDGIRDSHARQFGETVCKIGWNLLYTITNIDGRDTI